MNIEAEAAQAVAVAKTGLARMFPRDHPIQAALAQENPVTQPQQPARVVDSLHAITSEIQANPLVARLIEHGLGKMLTVPEADSIATLIAGIEQPRRTAAQAQQHDDAQQGQQ